MTCPPDPRDQIPEFLKKPENSGVQSNRPQSRSARTTPGRARRPLLNADIGQSSRRDRSARSNIPARGIPQGEGIRPRKSSADETTVVDVDPIPRGRPIARHGARNRRPQPPSRRPELKVLFANWSFSALQRKLALVAVVLLAIILTIWGIIYLSQKSTAEKQQIIDAQAKLSAAAQPVECDMDMLNMDLQLTSPTMFTESPMTFTAQIKNNMGRPCYMDASFAKLGVVVTTGPQTVYVSAICNKEAPQRRILLDMDMSWKTEIIWDLKTKDAGCKGDIGAAPGTYHAILKYGDIPRSKDTPFLIKAKPAEVPEPVDPNRPVQPKPKTVATPKSSTPTTTVPAPVLTPTIASVPEVKPAENIAPVTKNP